MESVALGRSLQNVEGPLDAKNDDIRLGVHNWSCHGIQGRGVLIDMVAFSPSFTPPHSVLIIILCSQVSYYTRDGAALPYDPWRTHAVSLEDLKAAATHQGVIFQPCVYALHFLLTATLTLYQYCGDTVEIIY